MNEQPEIEHDPQSSMPRLSTGRPLTPAHKALITLLAEIAVEQYLAEEQEQ